MARKVRKSVNAPDIQFKDPDLARLMQFVRAQANEIQRLQDAFAGGTLAQVLTKLSPGDYDATWQDAAQGNITGAKNLGAGKPLFKDVEAGLIALRSLVQGDGITITQADTALTISANIPPSGDGTVKSVGINSVDLEVLGSPVTTDGVIELEINEKAVTYDKIQDTTTDAVVIGRNSFSLGGSVGELTLSQVLDFLGGAEWGSILFRGVDGWQYLPPGLDGDVLTTHDVGVDPTWAAPPISATVVGATFTAGNAAMTVPTNDVAVLVEVSGTIQLVEILTTGGPGSLSIDVLQTDYSTYPTATSITGGAPPTISSADKYSDALLTGWSTVVVAGEILIFRLLSTSTFKSAVIRLLIG